MAKTSGCRRGGGETRPFGLMLQKLRKRAGLTQRDLAMSVDVYFSYLSKIENGVVPVPSENVISRLTEALNVGRDEFLGLAARVPPEVAQELKHWRTVEFRAKLRQLRIKAGMTQHEVATKISVDDLYVSKMEGGLKPPPSGKVPLRLLRFSTLTKMSYLPCRVGLALTHPPCW